MAQHPSLKKLPGSRQSCFEQLDRPALKPLPPVPYELARWKKATVHLDYHVEVEGHYYSVPYRLVRKQVDIRYTATTVECLYRGERVASHLRLDQRGRHTTIKEHMPIQHLQYRGVDTGAVHPLGSHHRPGNRPPDRNAAGQPGASAAVLPLAAGHPATGQILWRILPGSGLQPVPSDQRPFLPLSRTSLIEQARGQRN